MASKTIASGVYTIMGPGGQLTDDGRGLVLLQPGFGPPQTQQWKVEAGSDTYTLRNLATGRYIGTDNSPDQPSWMLPGTSQPFPWTLTDGPDGDPTTFLIGPAASGHGLRLAPSILRIWPPQVALAPPAPQFDFEWSFQPA
jgi:hypothetical protein